MKKVLLTIIASLFILIPISVNADLTCTYNPKTSAGDNFGEIKITKKSNGSFLVNDQEFNSASMIDLKYKASGTELYFPGGPVDIKFGKTIDKATVKKNNAMENHCNTYKRGSCGTNIKNVIGPSQFVYDCHNGTAIVHCNVKDSSIKPGGNYNVLTSLFTSNTCPRFTFGAEYSTDYDKLYVLILTDNDTKNGEKTTAISESGTTVNEGDVINIKWIYYTDNKKNDTNSTYFQDKEYYNFFSSVVYNKSTGILKFTHSSEYSDDQFTLDPNVTGSSYTTINLKKTIKFMDTDYDQIQFIIYKGFKAKLDNWTNNDYINVIYSTNTNIPGTLTYYIVNSSDVKDFAKDTWNYDDNQASTLYQNTSQDAHDILGIVDNASTAKKEVEIIPFCAATSGFLKVFKIIGYVIVVIKILVPIALIIFGSIDFAKAVISSNDDAIKKATSAVIQRAIIAVMVFFIPTIVYYFVGLMGNAIDRNDSYFSNCNTCLLKPDDCPAREPFIAEKSE